MTSRIPKHFRTTLFLTVAIVAIPSTHAQDASKPSIRATTHYILKSDRTGDMAAAIQEYNEILKKARWDKTYTIWRSASGPAEMMRVDYYDKWADLDANTARDPKLKDYQAEITRITARINESFVSSNRVIDIVNQEASMPRPAEPPKMLMIWTAHVKADKMREAVDLEKNEYAAAMKTTGVKTYIFAVTRYGGPANEIRSSTGLDNWAAIDQPNMVRKAMGDDKYRAFTAKMDALLEDYRYDIYRYDAELSFTGK